MSEVVGASRFAQRRADTTRTILEQQARDRFNKQTERITAMTEAGKCCTTIETGNHPHDDWHICLRTKDHKGYHMDKITGLDWKWNIND